MPEVELIVHLRKKEGVPQAPNDIHEAVRLHFDGDGLYVEDHRGQTSATYRVEVVQVGGTLGSSRRVAPKPIAAMQRYQGTVALDQLMGG